MENPDVVLGGLLSSMRKLLVVAGIPKSQINLREGKHKIDTYNKAFDWLHDLYVHPKYVHHVYVYNLVAPETWERYKTHGVTGLREQEMLRVSSKAIKILWKKKRPQLFGRDKVDKRK